MGGVCFSLVAITFVRVLGAADKGFKCIYLGPDGCLWYLKPIVCEMFICDDAEEQVFSSAPGARQKWEELKQLKKHFTWPDRPVLFDALEAISLKAGYTSPYLNRCIPIARDRLGKKFIKFYAPDRFRILPMRGRVFSWQCLFVCYQGISYRNIAISGKFSI